MYKIIALMSGGALGTLSRYYLSGYVNNHLGLSFPYGTYLVNISGSFIVGFLWGISESVAISPNWRTFLFVGCLGGFTTFSTYMLESMNYIREGNLKTGMLNLIVSTVTGLILVFMGFMVSRFLFSLNR